MPPDGSRQEACNRPGRLLIGGSAARGWAVASRRPCPTMGRPLPRLTADPVTTGSMVGTGCRDAVFSSVAFAATCVGGALHSDPCDDKEAVGRVSGVARTRFPASRVDGTNARRYPGRTSYDGGLRSLILGHSSSRIVFTGARRPPLPVRRGGRSGRSVARRKPRVPPRTRVAGDTRDSTMTEAVGRSGTDPPRNWSGRPGGNWEGTRGRWFRLCPLGRHPLYSSGRPANRWKCSAVLSTSTPPALTACWT